MKKVNKKIRAIRALVVENLKEGTINVEYDKSKFDSLIKNKEDYEVTKIYELTNSIKNYVLDKLIKNSDIDKSEKFITQLSDIEMFLDILPKITDIPYKSTSKKDMKELEEDLKNPPEVLVIISNTVSNMLLGILLDFLKNIKTVSELPQEAQELILKSTEIQELQEQLDEENKIKEDVKEVKNTINLIKKTETNAEVKEIGE